MVCEREEQAIAAARQLKVQLAEAGDGAVPASERPVQLHARAPRHVEREPVDDRRSRRGVRRRGARWSKPTTTCRSRGTPSIGPAHALADPSNGQMTIYSNDMKSYGMRNGVAQFLGMPREQGARRLDGWPAGLRPHRGGRCRVSKRRSSRRNSDGRCACSGCATKKRRGTRRARRSPSRCAAALDAQGKLVALDYDARAADYNHLGYNEPDTVLIAQLMGSGAQTPAPGSAAIRRDMYAIPNRARRRRGRRHCRSSGKRRCAPATCAIRTVRSPRSRPSRSSTRLAVAAKADPRRVPAAAADGEHRRRQRLQARAVDRGAQGGGGKVSAGTRGRRRSRRGTGDILTGRGIAYAFRSQTVVAQIAEVEVNRETGRVWVKRLVCAHDCGLVINPGGAAPHRRGRHAARAEPRAVRRGRSSTPRR